MEDSLFRSFAGRPMVRSLVDLLCWLSHHHWCCHGRETEKNTLKKQGHTVKNDGGNELGELL